MVGRKMNPKVGRNDLCPCGSGKKYKKCCLIAETIATQANAIADARWHRLRQLEGTVVGTHLLNYVETDLPPKMIEEAESEFFQCNCPKEADRNIVRDRIFLPWFFFHWIPSHSFKVNKFVRGITVAQNYVNTHRDKISDEELSFIEAAVNSHYSFYCVLNVEVGKSLGVRDILLGTTHTLKEVQGTFALKRGDIVFLRILTIDDQSISISMYPYVVQAKYHTDIIDFRNLLMQKNAVKALSSEMLRGDDSFFVLDFLFRIMNELFNPTLPILMNTDEELMVFVTSYFALSMDLEEVASRLAPLSCTMELADILDTAERDKSGKIKRLEFCWDKKGNKKHRNWDNTILGDIEVVQGKLTLDVNSKERAERGRALLEECFGDKISFQKSIEKTQEQQMQEIENSEPKADVPPKRSAKELKESEEAKSVMVTMAKAHWESWLHEPLQALGGKTPLQAARSKAGRERLDAILLEFEWNAANRDETALEPDIANLKKRLRLDSDQEFSSNLKH
ncbi:MAG: SEC-C domain-containing protein [Holosporales bacterium]|nr:SEC-C domain-containing protein [Holosporales bacterium]